MTERRDTDGPGEPTDLQQAVFELVHDRLGSLFGPGGSFRVSLGRATAEDAVFVDTVAETIAWHVAAALDDRPAARAQHATDADAAEEHVQLWSHIERELLLRRTGPDSIDVDVEREAVAGAASRATHAA